MLPAYDEDLDASAAIAADLVDLGCAEICCVGPRAEELHDSIDGIVEDKGALHVVTTWHVGLEEGSEYFVDAAAGRPFLLMGLVADHPDLAAALRRMAFGR
jgi:hypothetical protein